MNSSSFEDFGKDIIAIVGRSNFLFKKKETIFYRQGIRIGGGSASSVIFPSNLIEFWRVLKICISFRKIIIIQAANTGLTGGSTPSGEKYDRDVVIINTLKMNKLILLNSGSQVIAFPGATLHRLEEELSSISRSPHSVIGSSCIGASVIGGICNNSGGNLVNRGPAYTELSLYARLNSKNELELVNHLGIDLGVSPEEIISNLENTNFDANNINDSSYLASDIEYKERVRKINENTPARFNSDKRRLYEASGCAGKIAVFAVRLDTFPKAKDEVVFFVGTNEPSNFTELRKKILSEARVLPDMGEYMHRSYFDGSYNYCKDTFKFIKHFGTDALPRLLRLKRGVDNFFSSYSILPDKISDRFLQCFASILPDHLPNRIREFRNKYEHYLVLKTSDQSINEIQSILDKETFNKSDYEFFQCNKSEGEDLLLHRYVAGSAPMRFALLNIDYTGDLLPLDVALPRNCDSWYDIFPSEILSQMSEFFQMGHFLCMVFHWDFVLKKGVDALEIKKKIFAILDEYGAKYPAEHNVGHIYEAETSLVSFYKDLDPSNTFNPGIGKTSKKNYYK